MLSAYDHTHSLRVATLVGGRGAFFQPGPGPCVGVTGLRMRFHYTNKILKLFQACLLTKSTICLLVCSQRRPTGRARALYSLTDITAKTRRGSTAPSRSPSTELPVPESMSSQRTTIFAARAASRVKCVLGGVERVTTLFNSIDAPYDQEIRVLPAACIPTQRRHEALEKHICLDWMGEGTLLYAHYSPSGALCYAARKGVQNSYADSKGGILKTHPQRDDRPFPSSPSALRDSASLQPPACRTLAIRTRRCATFL